MAAMARGQVDLPTPRCWTWHAETSGSDAGWRGSGSGSVTLHEAPLSPGTGHSSPGHGDEKWQRTAGLYWRHPAIFPSQSWVRSHYLCPCLSPIHWHIHIIYCLKPSVLATLDTRTLWNRAGSVIFNIFKCTCLYSH